MPEMIRPTSSHGSVLARAMNTKSRPSPRQESRITGRRPKRSDSAPWIGEVTNWMPANTVPNTPTQYAALAVSPPTKSSIRCGSTGMITPNASTSISTVTKMKARAARRTRGVVCAFKGVSGWLPGDGTSVAHRARGEHGRMLAHVMGPVDHGILEPGQVAGAQCARGFLEPARVAGDGVHETIGRFLALAALIAAAVAARGLDQAAQRHRGAAGLGGEPGPVARQQGDFARDD